MQYAHAGEQGCVGNWTHTTDLQPWSTHLLEGGGVSRVPYWRQPTAAPTLTCIISGSTLSMLLLEATAPLLMTSTMAGQRVRMCSRNESRASGTSLGQDGLRVKDPLARCYGASSGSIKSMSRVPGMRQRRRAMLLRNQKQCCSPPYRLCGCFPCQSVLLPWRHEASCSSFASSDPATRAAAPGCTQARAAVRPESKRSVIAAKPCLIPVLVV